MLRETTIMIDEQDPCTVCDNRYICGGQGCLGWIMDAAKLKGSLPKRKSGNSPLTAKSAPLKDGCVF